jgi:acetoacetyl-CoA reductase
LPETVTVVAELPPEFDNKDEWLKEMEAAGFKDFVCVAEAT